MNEIYCKGMTKSEYNKSYYAANRDRCKDNARAHYHNVEKHRDPVPRAIKRAGVDASTVPAMPLFCEACGSRATHGRNFHLDHDHGTGKFRGWLCHGCNTALGGARDMPEILRKLATYLEQR